MERTLVILKPSAIARELVGAVIERFQRRGLIIQGLKMIQLDDAILKEHYAHLVDKPFFPSLARSMKATPVIVMALAGLDAVNVVRAMTGATNGRNATPGTIRGDFCVSNQQNIVHASDSVENANIELKRFFSDNELFDYQTANFRTIYADDEV
ncbi:MAG: nucleoside-diphosphate kinase [Muribaculaceae bacterium]|nr:nucleoside-diphosphate kinase [Muribaculaceae bacterium]